MSGSPESSPEPPTPVFRKRGHATSMRGGLTFKAEKQKRAMEGAFESTMSAAPAGPEDGGATLINILAADEAFALEQSTKTGGGVGSGGGSGASARPAGRGGGAQGPIKAPVFIRQSVRFDYQPDVCKDYKETGYCGFGDACKFVHDRGDYKTGWQLEKEWEEEQKKKRVHASRDDDGAGETDAGGSEPQLPATCPICEKPIDQPVVTRCGHHFCEKCALKRFATNKRCAVCDQPTNGIFNRAAGPGAARRR